MKRETISRCKYDRAQKGMFVQALAALFLMNNVHYIVKAVESSEALSVVGQDWIERHKDLIEQYGEEYQASPSHPAHARPCLAYCLVGLQHGRQRAGTT